MTVAPDAPTLRSVLGDRWLVAAIAVALLLRVTLVAVLDGEMTLIGDENLYLKMAKNLLETGRLETGGFVRPPLYFLFLALMGAVAGPTWWVLAANLVQCIASCATALPVYRSALRIGGVRAARIAAVFLLFDPTLIAFSHLLWPETLFLLAVAIVFDGVVGLDATQVRRAVGLGALTGAAMLLKPVFGIFTLVLAVDWLRRLGLVGALHLALIFGGTAAVVISPWVVRNQLRYGGSIVLENQGSYNLWSGNAKEGPQVLAEWRRLDRDPRVRNRVATERGMRAIREDPERFVEMSGRRALNFFGFEYFAVRHLAVGGYPEMPRSALLVCFWIIEAGWALALLSAAVGLGPVSRDPTLRLVLIYALLFVALVSTMVVTTRFRVPFTFVTAIAGGIGVDRLLRRRVGWRSLVLAACAVAVLAISASRPVFLQLFRADFETREQLVNKEWILFRY
jgi:4-amino-4-deoxy-L-arabinose transferase-like glycosyltransferase